MSQYAGHNNTAAVKENFRILHSVSGKTKADPNFQNDRHVITYSVSNVNPDTGKIEFLSINLSIQLPNTGVITRAEVDKGLDYVLGFAGTTANIDKCLRNET